MPGLRIYNNVYSMNAQRYLGSAGSRMAGDIERLSSGLRINSGKDDAAGLAISENLRSDVRSYEQALRNTSDSISVLNIAEGSMNLLTGNLTRMRELAIQAANFTVGSAQRASINQEYQNMKDEIDRVSLVTNFNGQYLLDGSMGSSATTNLIIQADIDNNAQSQINLNSYINLTNMDVSGLNVSTTTVLTAGAAQTALSFIDSAMNYVTGKRGELGAVQNRLEKTISNLEVSIENTQAADSRLRDADMAKEISKFTRDQILMQTGTSMVAQANQIPQTVLKLLQ